MSLMEISEVLTVEPDDDCQFDIERRLVEPHELLTMCSSLVTTVRQKRLQSYFKKFEEEEELLQIAHFSVREYLESASVHDGLAKQFAIHEMRAETLIAESCLIYFLQFVPQTALKKGPAFQVCEDFPLAKYAAKNWAIHARQAEEGGNIIPLCKAFLLRGLYPPNKWTETSYILTGWGKRMGPRDKSLPLMIAIGLNLPNVTKALILDGADVNLRNTFGCTPLMEISRYPQGHFELVQLLLDSGADINAQDDWGRTALMIACSGDVVQIVPILLDGGADMEAKDKKGNTALLEAMGNHSNARTAIVQHLVRRGVSMSSPKAVEALHLATVFGEYKGLQTLLERGFDVNAEPENRWVFSGPISPFNTALLLALERGNVEIAELLLKHGADVNARSTLLVVDKPAGVALEHALNYGDEDMLRFLLEHGADESLVKPEGLNENGTKRYEEMLLKLQSPDRSSGVQEVETEESEADA